MIRKAFRWCVQCSCCRWGTRKQEPTAENSVEVTFHCSHCGVTSVHPEVVKASPRSLGTVHFHSAQLQLSL